jgi:ISXO2 transposase-like protein/transposase-like zinc ribbon protein
METLDAFDKRFPTEDSCRDYLRDSRWPTGIVCPKCKTSDKIFALKTKPYHWLCKNCKNYRFSVITRTIFENTKKPLKLWFRIAYFMLVSKKGMSALQIHRTVFGEDSTSDYHTTWFMCQRLRAAMRNQEWFQLMGEVEVDETYVGGKDRNRHWNKKSKQQRDAGTGFGYGKVGVIGAIARKGNVVCQVMEEADFLTYQGFVRRAVSERVSLVATDENIAYKHLGLPHESVSHSRNEYVRGNVHTNNIESFWSLLKRGVVGTFHKVSAPYLPLYLAEFSFRFNNRKNPDIFGELLSRC